MNHVIHHSVGLHLPPVPVLTCTYGMVPVLVPAGGTILYAGMVPYCMVGASTIPYYICCYVAVRVGVRLRVRGGVLY